jgi:hypothetical protein
MALRPGEERMVFYLTSEQFGYDGLDSISIQQLFCKIRPFQADHPTFQASDQAA